MLEEDCIIETDTIPIPKTGYFSKMICDYLDQDKSLQDFYGNFPDLKGFKDQIKEKTLSLEAGPDIRSQLFSSLKDQYRLLQPSKSTVSNIELLKNKTTFTICTGHQLNLFTGPLYFLYKIVSTINLTKRLKSEFPEFDFVPVYWMATEDHDFEEINYFNFHGKKIKWHKESKGGVGRLTTSGLEEVFKIFSKELGHSKHAEQLKTLFKRSYLEHSTLTEATRFLANALFGQHGLVIIDGDDKGLKKLLIPQLLDEFNKGLSFKEVLKTTHKLSTNYPIQVNPRELNVFYLKQGLRERIIEKDGLFIVNSTDISFTKDALLNELKNHPERFSPNVIMRPLYQEQILPNLCYIGGGGELAYWFELKSYFKAAKVVFPILLLRNSVLLISEKQQKKLKKLNISTQELFLKKQQLVNKKIKEISEIKIDFNKQRDFLKEQFKELEKIAERTDRSFIGAVRAQTKKQLKGLDMLEKRLLKAERRKHDQITRRINNIHEALFPNASLEERQRNFSEFYSEYGDDLIVKLINNLDPLKGEFTVLCLD